MCPRAPCDVARLTTLCLHASSRTCGTRQHGGNAEAGFCYSQDLLLLSFGLSTGRPGLAGAWSPLPGSGGSAGLQRSARESPSSKERDPGAPLPLEWSQSTAEAPSRPHAWVSLPQRQCCRPCPACTFSGGNRAQSIRVHEAALPWASLCGGKRFTRRCTGIWDSAATEGPPSLAGAALGGPLVGPARGPSPARATLRAGCCLFCPVHVSARKLDWSFEVFLPAAFSYMSE